MGGLRLGSELGFLTNKYWVRQKNIPQPMTYSSSYFRIALFLHTYCAFFFLLLFFCQKLQLLSHLSTNGFWMVFDRCWLLVFFCCTQVIFTYFRHSTLCCRWNFCREPAAAAVLNFLHVLKVSLIEDW